MGFGANFLGLSPYLNAIMRDYMAQQNMQRQLQMQQQLLQMKDQYERQHQRQVYTDYIGMKDNNDISNMFSALGAIAGGGFLGPAMQQVEQLRNSEMVYPLEAMKLKQTEDAFETQQAAARTRMRATDISADFTEWKSDIAKKQYESNKKLSSSFGQSILQMAKTIGVYSNELASAVKDAQEAGNIEMLSQMWKMISAGGQIKASRDRLNKYIELMKSRAGSGGGGLSTMRYDAQLLQKEAQQLDKEVKNLIVSPTDKNLRTYGGVVPTNAKYWLDTLGNLNQMSGTMGFNTRDISNKLRENLKQYEAIANNGKLDEKGLARLQELRRRTYQSALPAILEKMKKHSLTAQAQWLKSTSETLTEKLSRLAAVSYLARKHANDGTAPNESEIYEMTQQFKPAFQYIANAFAWHKLTNPESDDEKILNALIRPYLGSNTLQLLNELSRSSLGFWQGGGNVTE